MDLYTTVSWAADGLPRFSQADSLLAFGSCFATEMGRKLCEVKFRCDVNPYGVLYNPLSIAAALREVEAGELYGPEQLFRANGLWHSMMHHSDFSAVEAEETLRRINTRLAAAHEGLRTAGLLLLTFGTAWVYEAKATGRIVGNCHKLPEREFVRRRLSEDEVVQAYVPLLSGLLERNEGLRIILTVSPIRHVRDGLHENQLGKAVLLLAVDRLCGLFPGRLFYFPAYELLLDELRDYRFYADDLVHPSKVAVDYVWERFAQACFSRETLRVIEECEKIRKSVAHKPFHPESGEYKRFLEQIVLKIDQLTGKYPYLDFQNEREVCRTQLKI